MGHRNSAEALTRLLSMVLKGLLWKTAYSYIDDILLLHHTEEEHLLALRQVLQRFRDHNLKLNAQKSIFAVGEIPFLGYKISKDGLSLDLKNCKSSKSTKLPLAGRN